MVATGLDLHDQSTHPVGVEVQRVEVGDRDAIGDEVDRPVRRTVLVGVTGEGQRVLGSRRLGQDVGTDHVRKIVARTLTHGCHPGQR